MTGAAVLVGAVVAIGCMFVWAAYEYGRFQGQQPTARCVGCGYPCDPAQPFCQGCMEDALHPVESI